MKITLETGRERTPAVEWPDCPLCGSSQSRTLFVARDRLLGRPGEFPVVRCAGCGLVFLRPRPAPDALGAYYPDAYYPLDEGPSPEAYAAASGLLASVGAWTRHRGLDEPRVLDVGCGAGVFLHLARKAGMRVQGVELSESAVEYARAKYGLNVHCGTLADADLREQSFDIVTMWHVLEHLPDPIAALERVSQALKPGGLLLLAVPNFGSFEARIFGRRWFSLDAPRHLYHFTPDTLRATLDAGGFNVERIVHSSGTAGLVYSLMGDLTGVSLKLRGRPLSDAAYRRAAHVLHRVVRPLCASAARAGRGGALEAYAVKQA